MNTTFYTFTETLSERVHESGYKIKLLRWLTNIERTFGIKTFIGDADTIYAYYRKIFGFCL